MIIKETVCDICGCEIAKRDIKEISQLEQDSINCVSIGKRIVVEDCCDNCMKQLELCLEHMIQENNHD